jgi:lipoprotein-anchoring transpeptidase ErfK/SrfK
MVLAVSLLGVAWNLDTPLTTWIGQRTGFDPSAQSSGQMDDNDTASRSADRDFLQPTATDELVGILDGQTASTSFETPGRARAFRTDELADVVNGIGELDRPVRSANFGAADTPSTAADRTGATGGLSASANGSRPGNGTGRQAASGTRRSIVGSDDVVYEDVPHRTTILAQAESSLKPIPGESKSASEATSEPQPNTAPARTEPELPDSPLQIAARTAKDSTLVDLTAIEEIDKAGDFETALREYSKWYWKKPEVREALQKRLDELAAKIFFSTQPHVMEPYVIQPGDQLRTIARKYNVSWEYLARLNKTDPKKIRAGQKLKVVQGPFSAVVSVSQYRLYVHLNGAYVKSYRVGLGKDNSTPLGSFTVKEKLVNPTYYGPEGVIKADDPKNPLGERWIDIGESYGIHGTIEPESIGKNESRGCIRLLNSDVEELYDFLTVGSQVLIQK